MPTGGVPPPLPVQTTRDTATQTTNFLDTQPTEEPPPPMPKKQRLVQSQVCHRIEGFEDAWPQSTAVHCWHCAHGFDGPPVGIPLARRDGRYVLQGVYCSIGCMKAANAERPSHERASSGQLIHEMLREVYGITGVVNKAPPKQVLRKFGGSMSIEEFRAAAAHKAISIVTPPLMAVKTFYEEIPVVTKTTAFQGSKTFANTSAPLLPVQMKKVAAGADGGDGDDEATLRLKRPRPLPSKQSLDCFMGITRGDAETPPKQPPLGTA